MKKSKGDVKVVDAKRKVNTSDSDSEEEEEKEKGQSRKMSTSGKGVAPSAAEIAAVSRGISQI